MKKQAFTLAEVLITLVIIGVIAAMTIPTLMGNTNNAKYKTRFKKAMSAVNQALELEYVLYGNNIMTNWNAVSVDKYFQMLTNHMALAREDAIIDGEYAFKTADGNYFSLFENGWGFTVVVDFNSGWRWAGDSCNSPESCERANINAFTVISCDPSGTGHKVCPQDVVGYAYLYDLSLQEAFDKFNGSVMVL